MILGRFQDSELNILITEQQMTVGLTQPLFNPNYLFQIHEVNPTQFK